MWQDNQRHRKFHLFPRSHECVGLEPICFFTDYIFVLCEERELEIAPRVEVPQTV